MFESPFSSILSSAFSRSVVLLITFLSVLSFTLDAKVAEANFIRMDQTSQGRWHGIYGKSGAILSNYWNEGRDSFRLPPFINSYSYSTGTLAYTWSANTTDVRSPASLGGVARPAACVYHGTRFTLHLNASDKTSYILSLYLLDWDSSARSQMIMVRDAVSNAVLAQNVVSSFHDGVLVSYVVSGSVLIEISRVAGANAVLSGVFFDQELPNILPPPPPPPGTIFGAVSSYGAQFLKDGTIWYNCGGGGGCGRGINVAALAPNSGELIGAVRRFDTWGQGVAALQALLTYLNGLPQGTLMLFAVGDEAGALRTTEEGKAAMEALGSKMIRQVGFRYAWAMIVVKGQGTAIAEGVSDRGWHQSGFVPVKIEASFEFPL
jgi:hypothetical protein